MNRSLLNVLLGLIQKGGQNIDPVRNLLGTSVSNATAGLNDSKPSNWKIYSLPNVINAVPWSPDDIMNHITSLQMLSAPIATGVNGIVVFPTDPGTTLATTIANLPYPVTAKVEVNAPSKQIAIYAHETLVQRGTSNLIANVSLPTGKTAINVVTQGTQASTVEISLPPDIQTDFTAFAPPPPTWISSGAANAGYIDPTTGHVGVQLFWNNQTNVGGWDVYKVFTQDFGTILQCSTINGKYTVITNFSGTALLPYPGSVIINSGVYVGVLEDATYSVDLNTSTFHFKSFDLGDTVLSGELMTANFQNIAVIPRNTNDSIVTYIDETVQIGSTYTYTLDSFSVIDPTLRSDKIQSLTVTTPNVPGIGSATLIEQTPNTLTLTLSAIDPQVRYWSGWIRKNNWPTVLSGSSTAQLNNDYLKFYDEDSSQTTFTFTATNGFWYGIIVPYDANNNPGARTICSGAVNGQGTGGGGGSTLNTPAILLAGVDLINDGTGVMRNKIWWNTNQAAERPGSANGDIQVNIKANNFIETPNGPIDITQPVPRYVWQDFEDNYANTPDTTNSILLYGSMLDTNAAIQVSNPKYSTWFYTITLISGGVTLSVDHASISGNYSVATSTGGTGGGGGTGGKLKT